MCVEPPLPDVKNGMGRREYYLAAGPLGPSEKWIKLHFVCPLNKIDTSSM